LVCACSQTNPPHADFPSLSSIPPIAGFGTEPLTCVPDAQRSSEPSVETQAGPALAEGQGSFGLCLYALLGLGLCRSAPLVRKLSFGCIPDWYHHGGPFQIGHSHVIGPDCLCSATVVCFIQPDCTADGLSPQYYWGTIASLLQKSQFSPTALASRGPPSMS
jgi:hypothetical protein